jgi:hypothetical protein
MGAAARVAVSPNVPLIERTDSLPKLVLWAFFMQSARSSAFQNLQIARGAAWIGAAPTPKKL